MSECSSYEPHTHCETCGYRADPGTCPECGQTVRPLSERGQPPPRPPSFPLQMANWASAASFTIAAIVCLVAGPAIVVLLLAMGVTALVATFAAISALGRNVDRRLPHTLRITWRRVILALVGGSGSLIAWFFISNQVFKAFERFSLEMVTRVNLLNIGAAFSNYSEFYASCPPGLDSFISDHYLNNSQLFDALDPAASSAVRSGTPAYSSFVYWPPSPTNPASASTGPPGVDRPPIPNDPHLILAFGKKKLAPLRPALLSGYGRWVLFGDGSVAALSDADFQTALQADRAARSKLGLQQFPAP